MKTLIKYLLAGVSMVSILPLMTACSDDESTDPYDINYGYVYNPPVTEHTITYLENGTFRTAPDEIEKLTQVRCTRPAPNDLVFTVSLDKSLVDAYNEKNGTDYAFLENAVLLQSTYTIRKGEYISQDTIKVKYTDMSEFVNGNNHYILPVTVTSLEGGAQLSENRTFYLTYHSSILYIEESEEALGTEITNFSEWTCLLDGESCPKVIDGNNNNYQYIPDGSVLDVDLGKNVSLESIGLNFYAWYYSCGNVSLSVSTDGTNYEEMGNIVFTSYDVPRYIHFLASKQCRYVKMALNGYFYSSSNKAYLRELYFFVAE